MPARACDRRGPALRPDCPVLPKEKTVAAGAGPRGAPRAQLRVDPTTALVVRPAPAPPRRCFGDLSLVSPHGSRRGQPSAERGLSHPPERPALLALATRRPLLVPCGSQRRRRPADRFPIAMRKHAVGGPVSGECLLGCPTCASVVSRSLLLRRRADASTLETTGRQTPPLG